MIGFDLLRFFFVLLILFQSTFLHAKVATWVGGTPKLSLSPKSSFSLQSEYRTYEEISFVLLRPMLSYKVYEGWGTAVGYDLFSGDMEERRIFVDLDHRASFDSFVKNTFIRLRHEFRYRNRYEEKGQRSRFLVKAKVFEKDSLSLYVFDEVFFAMSTFSDTYEEYDRNWLGVHMAYAIEPGTINFSLMHEDIHESDKFTVFILTYSLKL